MSKFTELDYGPVVPDSNPVRPVPIKSLVQKVAEACDKVTGVDKKGENKEQGYKFVKAADVAKAIRHELFSRGILVLKNEVACEDRFIQSTVGTGANQRTRTATDTKITVQYTITDGIETLGPFQAFGTGRDYSDKAVYKAKTGTLKYFLRDLGLIPDEKEDPESTSIEEDVEEEKEREAHLKTLEPKLKEQMRISLADAKQFVITAKRNNKTNEQITQYLHDLNGYIQAEEITVREWPEAMKWANSPVNDLTAIGKASIERAKLNVKALSRPDIVGKIKEAVYEQDI